MENEKPCPTCHDKGGCSCHESSIFSDRQGGHCIFCDGDNTCLTCGKKGEEEEKK